MTRPAASLPAAAALFLGVAVALAGCVGSGGGASGTPTGGTATTSAAGSSAATRSERPGPVTPTPGGSAVASPRTTTKTAWGRIWDALPATFPTYPGAEPADGAGPASAVLAVPADVAKVVDWYRQALGAAGYSIEALAGPMEDGSTVIDAVGLEPACRVQASIGPRGSHTLISILFAADCPFR